MFIRTLSTAILATIVASGAAQAATKWDAAKAVCADAIAKEAGVDASAFDAKLEKARDGATKRLTVSLAGADGQTITGECKVRGGEVTAVEIEA